MPTNMEVSGEIQTTCRLSGMPDLNLIFANPNILGKFKFSFFFFVCFLFVRQSILKKKNNEKDDVSFHPCVRYNRFEQNKVLSFVPPDGQFKLMTYRYI